MLISCLELALMLILAVFNDILTFKIKNILVLPFIAIGCLTHLLASGLPGLAASAAAASLPVLLLIGLFALRMLGAGDIKLFCAIGAISGTGFLFRSMVLSFLAGGVLALFLLLLRKNARSRPRHMKAYLGACFLSRSLLPYTDFTDKRDGGKFHFSTAIACGVLLTACTGLLPSI